MDHGSIQQIRHEAVAARVPVCQQSAMPSQAVLTVGMLSQCDSATPWMVACQASLSMGFSSQEYQSELPFPSPGDLPDTGIKSLSLASPALQADSLPLAPPGKYSLVNSVSKPGRGNSSPMNVESPCTLHQWFSAQVLIHKGD